jgi:hypothetical protein
MVRTVQHYLRVSRNIAEHVDKNILTVFLRILAARVFYGMGPDVYDRRRFSTKKLGQARGYLSLRERESLQKRLCSERSRKLVESKLLFYEKCLSSGIPTPSIYGVVGTMDTRVPDGIPVLRSASEFSELLDGLPAGRYVAKPVDGAHGLGISVFDTGNGRILDLEGKVVDPERYYRQIADSGNNSAGYLVQEFIHPHPDLKPIMPGPALGTFRIVTFLLGNQSVGIPYAIVKIPVGNSPTDNFDYGYSGNWVCPIDVGSGRLGNAVGKTDTVPVFSEIEKRPDTGATFRETVVPFWEEVKSTVSKAQLAFSELRSLGWDVAVTGSGVTIIEANWAWGENIIEVAWNRGIGKDLLELTEKSLLAGD